MKRHARKLFLLASLALGVTLLLGLARCAKRPVNPALSQIQAPSEDKFEGMDRSKRGEPEDLIILAFSGGGTRAAAFSYGVLEALRDIEVTTANGRKTRLLDEVDLITGVSGGSFTALGYGLYGDRLFDLFENNFLKRDVQRTLIGRLFNP
jgi:NTE family protein